MNEPIQDKAPKPPGLLPKHVQSWLILGLAVLMVVIMWLTSPKEAADPGEIKYLGRLRHPRRFRSTKLRSRNCKAGSRNCNARKSSRKTLSRNRPGCSAARPPVHSRTRHRKASGQRA